MVIWIERLSYCVGTEGWILDLNVLFPDHCISIHVSSLHVCRVWKLFICVILILVPCISCDLCLENMSSRKGKETKERNDSVPIHLNKDTVAFFFLFMFFFCCFFPYISKTDNFLTFMAT